MKIEVYKLNNGPLKIDEDIIIDKNDYVNTSIIDIKNVHVKGEININYSDELEYNLFIKGTFILPDDLTLEETDVDFDIEVEETGENIQKYLNKSNNLLDIYDIIWENIVSEVPISVRNEESHLQITHGEGWEISSKD